MSKRIPNTKQRILTAALTLFSENGFDLVTVAEIAEAVGIKAPSLYKHYKSKQDIYEAIIIEMDNRYKKHMALLHLDGKKAEKDREYYAHIDEDELVRFGVALFRYFLHDEYESKFRKMLTLTPFTNRDVSDVFVRRFFEDPLKYQEKSFKMLAKTGKLAPENPWIMALHFYAPIFLLLSLCDRSPEMEQEAVKMKELHIRQFIRVYGKIPHFELSEKWKYHNKSKIEKEENIYENRKKCGYARNQK